MPPSLLGSLHASLASSLCALAETLTCTMPCTALNMHANMVALQSDPAPHQPNTQHALIIIAPACTSMARKPALTASDKVGGNEDISENRTNFQILLQI